METARHLVAQRQPPPPVQGLAGDGGGVDLPGTGQSRQGPKGFGHRNLSGRSSSRPQRSPHRHRLCPGPGRGREERRLAGRRLRDRARLPASHPRPDAAADRRQAGGGATVGQQLAYQFRRRARIGKRPRSPRPGDARPDRPGDQGAGEGRGGNPPAGRAQGRRAAARPGETARPTHRLGRVARPS